MCRASGTGTLVYSWMKYTGSGWTTVSTSNISSYTTDTLLNRAVYWYRCRVSNEAGEVMSRNIRINVYGECDHNKFVY